MLLRKRFINALENCNGIEIKEPIFLTKNGEGDLVVMDIETFNRREKMIKLREELLHPVAGTTPEEYEALKQQYRDLYNEQQ